MSSEIDKIKEIFLEAIENHSPDQWDEFLERSCKGNIVLRTNVQELLDGHVQGASLIDERSIATIGDPLELKRDGQQVGPYKLREKIGEGGFGVVYVAEQKKPVSRKVALKVIKPGMDSKDVIARFEAERQALAMMDHPNVAKVLDAGATESRRPYFVMELVHGVPITKFCDTNKLTNRQRLEIFIDVCHAVQHAHQKGIIHRDLKPNNVMVSMADHRAVVKVIDFGVAKALYHNLTEKSIYTGYGQMVGTPMYMSPEQAQLSSLDIDTRSDIYSLGVLLYELLTGTTPFDKDSFKKAGFDEVRRLIREVEPRRPSEQVSTLKAEQISTISDCRNIEHGSLSRSLRGELDWIVMKTLEKDRNRRFETASALADDIRRFLNDEPVVACPPSRLYRFRKFALRNRAKIFGSASLGLAALVTIVVLSVSNYVVLQQKTIAEKQKSKAEEQKERAENNLDHVLATIEDFQWRIGESDLADVPGALQLRMRLLSDAQETLNAIVKTNSESPRARLRKASALGSLAAIHEQLGDLEKSRTYHKQSISETRAWLQDFPEHESINQAQINLAGTYVELASVEQKLGDMRKATAAFEDASALVDHLKHFSGQSGNRLLLLISFSNRKFSDHLRSLLKYEQAEEAALRAVKAAEELLSQNADSPDMAVELARSYIALGATFHDRQQDLAAIEHYSAAINLLRKWADKSTEKQLAKLSLAVVLTDYALVCGVRTKTLSLDECERLLDESVQLHRSLAEQTDNPDFKSAFSRTCLHLAGLNRVQGDFETSVRLLKEAVELQRALVAKFPRQPKYSQDLSRLLGDLAKMLYAMDEREQAAKSRIESIELMEGLVSHFPDSGEFKCDLVRNYYGHANDMAGVSNKHAYELYINKAANLADELVTQYPDITRYESLREQIKAELNRKR